MTAEHQKILTKINDYADVVLEGIDPQKTQISYQLEKLKPVMEEIAAEYHMNVEDVFILYMDLASEVSVENEQKFQTTFLNEDASGFHSPSGGLQG